jgi:hypothetical protein
LLFAPRALQRPNCADLTANQAMELFGLDRKTAIHFLSLFRTCVVGMDPLARIYSTGALERILGEAMRGRDDQPPWNVWLMMRGGAPAG